VCVCASMCVYVSMCVCVSMCVYERPSSSVCGVCAYVSMCVCSVSVRTFNPCQGKDPRKKYINTNPRVRGEWEEREIRKTTHG
jgi:hypothetical protein